MRSNTTTRCGALVVTAALAASAMPATTVEVDDQGNTGAQSVSITEMLRSLSPEERAAAIIDVETTRLDVEEARLIESLWATGACNEAYQLLERLERGPTLTGVAIRWQTPRQLAGPGDRGVDIRIGDPRLNAERMVIDFDAETGHLFTVVQWDDGWSVNMSTDGGASWAETYFMAAYLVDVDAAVVGDFLYVGYVAPLIANTPRTRRFFVGTGASDVVYGYRNVYDAAPADVVDICLETNTDSFDNRLYVAAIQNDAALRFWFTDADGSIGTMPWIEQSPAVTNAATGLDLHWNANYTVAFLYMTYLTTTGGVQMQRANAPSGSWELRDISSFYSGTSPRTAVSAYADHVVLAYEYEWPNGLGIICHTSLDGAETWEIIQAIAPPVPGATSLMADITARGGAGTAIVYTREIGFFDEAVVRFRSGYGIGGWSPAIVFNEIDVWTGTWTAINWLPPASNWPTAFAYGAMYISNPGTVAPYFDRFDSDPCPPDLNNDGIVNGADLGILLGDWGSPGLADLNYDGVTDGADLGLLLGAWGGC